jgi:hypothetical protein
VATEQQALVFLCAANSAAWTPDRKCIITGMMSLGNNLACVSRDPTLVVNTISGPSGGANWISVLALYNPGLPVFVSGPVLNPGDEIFLSSQGATDTVLVSMQLL